jgi:hypothetical protein
VSPARVVRFQVMQFWMEHEYCSMSCKRKEVQITPRLGTYVHVLYMGE